MFLLQLEEKTGPFGGKHRGFYLTKGGIRGIIRLTIKLNVNCLRKERRITWGSKLPCGALADPTRREILNLLKHGKKSAGEITQAFSITAAAISRHLSVLKEADLIRDQREGKYIFMSSTLLC